MNAVKIPTPTEWLAACETTARRAAQDAARDAERRAQNMQLTASALVNRFAAATSRGFPAPQFPDDLHHDVAVAIARALDDAGWAARARQAVGATPEGRILDWTVDVRENPRETPPVVPTVAQWRAAREAAPAVELRSAEQAAHRDAQAALADFAEQVMRGDEKPRPRQRLSERGAQIVVDALREAGWHAAATRDADDAGDGRCYWVDVDRDVNGAAQ